MTTQDARQIVYWHRELPPIDGEILHEHVVEATSERLAQEVARLGGDYAHVLDEHIDSRRDDAANESWLQGRFNYVLYRRASLR